MITMIVPTRATLSVQMILVLVLIGCASTNGFTIQRKSSHLFTQTNMIIDHTALTVTSPILSSATFTNTMNPLVEAEFFNDAAHIALDLTTFLGPATPAIRFAAVIGRICCILSDYLPDHSMLPEELVFQLYMLILASFGFFASVTPILQASLDSRHEYKDRKCFATLLRPAGCSWMQYKILMSQGAFQWKIVTANQRLVEEGDENVLYWVYSGQVRQAKNKAAKSGDLLGDLSLLMSTGFSARENVEEPKTPPLIAGSRGATVVRIDTTKLQALMDKDELLDNVVRNLLLNIMQETVAALTVS